MSGKNFNCPFCNTHTTLIGPNQFTRLTRLDLNKTVHGDDIGFRVSAVACPNPTCNELSLTCMATKMIWSGQWVEKELIGRWDLLPDAISMVLPDYVPTPIKGDYYEACKIRELSPKASAALSRRCLQGMIRDFWAISKKTLKAEIDAIKESVDPLVWESIDAVRSVGNIGAHMEKNINHIIDVEPQEAQLLLNLIEQLIKEWYVGRYERQARLEATVKLAADKNTQKKNAP